MSGPAYVLALRNALERRTAEYTTAPRTGGAQISTRFDEFVLNHVDAIVEECGWNRAEVLYALVQRGLFDLYEFVSPDVVERIVKKIVSRMAPPHPPAGVSPYPAREFEVRLDSREVIHRPSGIVFTFYPYTNERDWMQAAPANYRDNPDWEGDRLELARASKQAAVAAGMRYGR